MNTAQARKLGWTVEKGSYVGTCDDRADRWYAYKVATYNAIDRRGSGYATRKAALDAVEDAENAK